MSALWNKRRIAMATVLLLTLAAVVWANRLEQADAPASASDVQDTLASRETGTPGATAGTKSEPAVAAAPELAVARVAALRQADETTPRANVFAPKSFYVPPPKPKKLAAPPPPPPPPPAAPPLPFTYMGMLKEGGGSTVVFVVRGERLHSVRVGDVIDGTYRVEAVGSEEVTFVYLPMNEKQTLKIGG
jgi:hypothetical protein